MCRRTVPTPDFPKPQRGDRSLLTELEAVRGGLFYTDTAPIGAKNNDFRLIVRNVT